MTNSTTYKDNSPPYISAAWLNDVNTLVYTLFNGVVTIPAAGSVFRSNGSSWVGSTSTFADTYGASQLLYSNGANTVQGLATANSATLQTNSSGVPSLVANATARTNLGAAASGANTDITSLASQTGATKVIPWVIAGGTASAITATYNPPLTSLVDGMIVSFRSPPGITSNTNVTFNPNGLGAATILGPNGFTLLPGAVALNNGVLDGQDVFLKYYAGGGGPNWILINTPSAGPANFAISLTGMSSGGTGTATYSVFNGVVFLYCPAITGTSNATTMTSTGLPSVITPATSKLAFSVSVENNTSNLLTPGRMDIGNNGVISYFTDFGGSGWTSSGTKGLNAGFSISYMLN